MADENTNIDRRTAVLKIAAEVLTNHAPDMLKEIQERAAKLLPGVKVCAAQHSGREVWCPAFGSTLDPGVLASVLKGDKDHAVELIKAGPQYRVVAAGALAEFCWPVDNGGRT